MNGKLRVAIQSIIIGLVAISFLSLLIGYFSLDSTLGNNMYREDDIIYEAFIDSSGNHTAQELSLESSEEDISYYLRIKKYERVKEEPKITLPTLPALIIPEPEPVVEVVIPEPLPVVIEAPIAIPESPIQVEELPIIVEEVVPEVIEILVEKPIEQPVAEKEEEVVEEDDFWADFFVQGDELVLDAGYYFMSLFINDEYVGETEVYTENGISYLSMPYLKEYTDGQLSEEASNRLFSGDAEFLSEEELIALGLDVTIVNADWSVYIYFSAEDMPWRTISIAGLDRKTTFRPIVGAETVEKSKFSLVSKVAQTLNLSYSNAVGFDWNYNANLYNSFTIYDFGLNYSFSLRSNKDKLIAFNPGTLVIYREFPDQMLRVEGGNVQTSLLSPNGVPVGVSLKKDFAYASLGAKRKSVHNEVLSIETESKITVTNDGKTIYEKVLTPGNYRFEDFILYTGLNSINVLVEPTNGEPSYEIYHEFSYANSLYAPGESFYGASLAFGREHIYSEKYKRDGALAITLGDLIYQYDFKNIALSGYYNVGITKSVSINTALALANTPTNVEAFNPQGKLALEINAANPLGVLKTNFNLSVGKHITPNIYFRIGQQLPIDSKIFSHVNLGFTYNSPTSSLRRHSFALSASTSGKLIGSIGWNASGSLSLYTDNVAESPYSFSTGLSFSPVNNVSISASASLSGSYNTAPTLYGRLYGSVSFDRAGSATLSLDDKSTRTSYRVSTEDWNFNTDISSPSLMSIGEFVDPTNTTISMSGSTAFEKATLGTTLSANLDLSIINATITSSSNILYAGGAFAISTQSPNKFLLIKQDKSLKGNTISLNSPGQTKAEALQNTFSTALYSQLGTYGTSLELYSANEENAFLGVVNRTISIPEGKSGAYVYTIEADEVYQVSGSLKIDGLTYSDYSSPVYNVVEDEYGNINLEINNNYYFFTDAAGRFNLSDMEEGKYAFDLLDRNGEWHLCIIEISGDECDNAKMNLFEADSNYLDGSRLDYSRIINFRYYDALTESEYWDFVDAEWEAAI